LDVADGLDGLVMAGSEPATNVLEVEDNAYSS
jgi:hypothetical protein